MTLKHLPVGGGQQVKHRLSGWVESVSILAALLWQQELNKSSKEGSEQPMIFWAVLMTLWCQLEYQIEIQYASTLSMVTTRLVFLRIPRTRSCCFAFVTIAVVLVLQERYLAMCVPRSLKTVAQTVRWWSAHDVSNMIQQTSLSRELIKLGICCCFFIRHETWSCASTLNRKDAGIYERQSENSHKHTHTQNQ